MNKSPQITHLLGPYQSTTCRQVLAFSAYLPNISFILKESVSYLADGYKFGAVTLAQSLMY